MGRASGRKNLPRAPQVSPDTPEGREIGESARQDPAGSPIPGLTGNIVNYETVRREVHIGEPLPEFRGMMAHGVPPEEHTPAERAQAMRGEAAAHQPPRPASSPKTVSPPPPVPVYIVEPRGGGETYRTASPRHITVPGNSGADPVRICGRNPRRGRIGLLNEDTATNIRFAVSLADVANGGGALLPWPANNYLWLETQDELYALTTASGSVILSIIEEFETEL